MLALRVYRMIKEVNSLDGILKEASWEYNTACNYGCADLITQDFSDSVNASQDKMYELLNLLYNDAKLRKVAEILDKGIKELFEEWDVMPDDLPFM